MKKNDYLLIIIGTIVGLMIGYISFYNPDGSSEHTDEHGHFEEIEDVHSESEGHTEIEAVDLSDKTLNELGIKLAKVEPGQIENKITLTGEIAVDPVKVTHLRPRYTGIVKEIYVELGENVAIGDTIGIVESNESLVEFPLLAPVSGTIIDIHMSPGEIKGDHDHAIEIADLNYVWAIMTLYQKDIAYVSLNQKAFVYDELSGYSYSGKINFISPVIDESTRTTTARIELKNATHNWKPGMFVNADLVTGIDKIDLAVTKNAVQTYEGLTVVFVKDKFGFRPQPVTTGKQSSEYIEILSGLHLGDIYASEGAFTIKAELMKESFGGGHSH